jgi:hypothetical protein
MIIIHFILIIILFFTPLYAASPWGALSDGINQGIQNAYQIQQMRLMEEQRQAMEQQRQGQQRLLEQQKLMREQEQYRIEQQRLVRQEQGRAEHKVFIEKIRMVHPDFEKYLADGTLAAWIQKQPDDQRDLLLAVFNSGDADSSIALLTRFKKDNNISTIVE